MCCAYQWHVARMEARELVSPVREVVELLLMIRKATVCAYTNERRE